jgi:2',3'-cyclic-nucleotide 2'-phosphodiesterase (5'-nucleotidase family)
MLRILHTNDTHGTLTDARAEALRPLRDASDLYFDSGDAIKAGNLGIPLRPEAVWPKLSGLECTASALGNRETHVLESAFRAKLAGASHPLLCGNLRDRDGGRPLPGTLWLKVGDLRVGVFSVMVPMVTERMKTQMASRYLWDPPLIVARELANALRPEVDLLIALTHIGFRQDQELAETVPGIDIILGGHSHTALESPIRRGGTWICQGGSHCRYVGMYEWEDGRLSGGLRPFPG